ncbi:ADA2 2A isoform 1 [Hibiscus syriacus]|uniref:Glycosyltransferase n=1 Tax=Hibiscus syriacus TaxID=106335 RepID=A0A6A3CGS5_HIBSY|nr:UDP-glycosyltransferase 74G1-like [Hibiscus syriacus]KAE8726528.1 ADA2 2A isoform 1 [Hibiscus syriacus]
MGEPKAPHVLVFPYPAQGHINPILQFAKRLLSKGVKPSLVTTVFLSNSSDLTSTSIDLHTISDGFDEGGYDQAGSADIYLPTFWSVGPKSFAALVKKLGETGHPVDAVVYDGFMPWALDVAKQFGIPSAVFFTQSCAVNSVYYHVRKGNLQLPLPATPVSLPGLPTLQVSELPSFVCIYGSFPAWFDVVVHQFSNVDGADWVFFNIFYELEKEAVDWMSKFWNVKTVGPTIPSMYMDKRIQNDKDYGMNLFKPNFSACMNWLSGKPKDSVVYVSFGSFASPGIEQTAELASALKESDAYFLWVVRETEKARLPNNFIEETRDKGLVVPWCPQLEVLSHDSVGCFLTHCGFNSVLEALSLGVPMLAMPVWTDQPTNAKHVEDVWRIGVRARLDEEGIVRREVIKQCIRELVIEVGEKGKEIKKNSIKWKNLAKKAVDEGGSSDKNIDEFIAKLL